MRSASASLAGLCISAFLSTGAAAQDAKPPLPTCPVSGFSPAYYGVAGDNDGQQRGYEIASPCIGKEVRAAAVALGMGRWNPLGVKTLSAIRFKAKGKVARGVGGSLVDSDVDMSVDFTLPAARWDVTPSGGGAREISVFSVDQAWNETAPGVGRAPAPKAFAERAPLIKLTPFGAMWSVIEAEGKAKVSKDATGRTVISGASPLDGYPVTITLDAESRPVEVTARAEGHTYKASFSDYSDKWESAYLFVFPARMVWSRDGKIIANLEVTHYHSNPYVVFPPPRKTEG